MAAYDISKDPMHVIQRQVLLCKCMGKRGCTDKIESLMLIMQKNEKDVMGLQSEKEEFLPERTIAAKAV